MWSDNESEIDLLRFGYLTKAIQDVIDDPSLTPTTIGLFGDWGSGKSTLIKILQKGMAVKEEALCINFNGWLFEGYEDARTALMGSILDALKKEEGLKEKSAELFKKLTKRVNWFHTLISAGKAGVPLAMGMPHLALASVGADALTYLKDAAKSAPEKIKGLNEEEIKKFMKDSPSEEELRDSIREFREDFAKLLVLSKYKTLVIFIDDLDRCLPDTIIETLEAIRLFLFVPKTIFVIGADERLVEYAVRKRFPELPSNKLEIGRDYLEKMVQIPVRIPPLNRADMESFMNLLFAQKELPQADYQKVCAAVSSFTSNEIGDLYFDSQKLKKIVASPEAKLESDLNFIKQIAPILCPGLGGSPRRTKRFLNALMLRLKMGGYRGLKISRPIMAKLMLLEYIKPEFFKEIARLQSFQGGKPKEIKMAEERLKKATGTETGKEKSAETDLLLSDEWMLDWFKLEPSLSEVDLGPYFYIAHDKVGALQGSQARLSPAARDILTRLLLPNEAQKTLALKDSKSLSPVDITAVFEGLVERIRQADGEDVAHLHTTLFKLAETNASLISQIISFYNGLPDNLVPISVPTLLNGVASGPQFKSASSALFDKWVKSSTNSVLAKAAKRELGGRT